MKEFKTIVLIFSGYNHRAIIAYIRHCIANNIDFYIVSSATDDLIYKSIYKTKVIYTRNDNSLTVDGLILIKSIINKIVHKVKMLILPTSEYLNRFLLNNRTELEYNDFIIPLCSLVVYEKISDKYSFGQVCRENGIKIPREIVNHEKLRAPIIIKPKTYFISKNNVAIKPIIAKTNKDLAYHLSEIDFGRYYLQEYIPGNSIYLLYYFNTDGRYSVYSQENLIQQDDGLSIIAAKSSDIHTKRARLITQRFADIFTNLKFEGLIMVEVKYYKNSFYMIEANPRLWGPSQLINDSRMDLFNQLSFSYHLINKKPKTNYKTDIRYFWSGGLFEDYKKQKQTVFHRYTEKLYFKEFTDWIKSDIYLRPDTTDIYLYELQQ